MLHYLRAAVSYGLPYHYLRHDYPLQPTDGHTSHCLLFTACTPPPSNRHLLRHSAIVLGYTSEQKWTVEWCKAVTELEFLPVLLIVTYIFVPSVTTQVSEQCAHPVSFQPRVGLT